MLNAPTDTNVAPRLAPRQPQPRDGNPAPVGFSSLVEDKAAAKPETSRARPSRDADTSPRPNSAQRTGDSRDPNDRPPRDADRTSASDDATAPALAGIGKPDAKAEKPVKAIGDATAAQATDPSEKPPVDASGIEAVLAATDVAAPAAPIVGIVPIAPVIVAPPIAPTGPATSANAVGPLVIAAAGLAAAKAASPKSAATSSSEASIPDATPLESSPDAGEVVPTPVVGGKSKASAAVESPAVTIETGFAKPGDIKEPLAETTEAAVPGAAKPTPQAATQAPEAKPKDAVPSDDGAAASAPPAQPHDHRAAATPATSLDTASTGPQPVAPHSVSHAAASASPMAQLTATVATAVPVPLNGLAVELAARAQNGASRFQIRLDPAELGRIDVRIDIDRQGQVTSHLTVEKPETLAMLRQDSPQLQRALNDAGLKTADGALQFTLGDQSQPRQNADSGERQAQRFIIRDDEPVAPASPVRGYGRMFAPRGGVDISV